MTRITPNQVDSILRQALDVPDSAREAFLDKTCGEHTDLRAIVEGMLVAGEAENTPFKPGGALSGPLWNELIGRSMSAGLEAGDRVAAYRIVRTLGRGGMATVYLAERADGQFEQTVALKILHPSKYAENVAGRFAQERQILASLDHPNIARILDGGSTPAGQPYVVMEFIDGETIDVYCDRQHLGIDERLELFLKIADAVQCAHRNLVIHRDIKPANILVTRTGEPKLLDFGIAKLIDTRALPNAAPETRDFMNPMTPEFGSPEQISGQKVTTASDIYQLGVLLYELLTGCSPYSVDPTNLVAVIQAVCREEPAPPSQAIFRIRQPEKNVTGEAGTSADALAAARDTSPKQLGRTLAGDLDNIVLRALDKAPDCRYGTASQLFDDIHRYRQGEPVTARRASMLYRSTKFIRRHVAGVTVVTCSIFLAAGLVTYHAFRITEERDIAKFEADKAERIAGFMQGLLGDLSPAEMGGRTTTATDLLEKSIADIDVQFAGYPEIRGILYRRIGATYTKWGQYDRARELADKSVRILTDALGSNDKETLLSLGAVGGSDLSLGKLQEAEQLFRQILPSFKKVFGENSVETLDLLNYLGVAVQQLGGFDEAEGIYALLIHEALQHASEEYAEIACKAYNNLGTTYGRQNRYEDAAHALTKGYEFSRRQFGEQDPGTLKFVYNLAYTREKQNRFGDAESLYRRVLAAYGKVLGDEHPLTFRAKGNLGILYRRMGRTDEAYALLQVVVEESRAVLGPSHRKTLFLEKQLAAVLRDQGRLREAEVLYRQVLGTKMRVNGEDSVDALSTTTLLASVLALQRRFDEAEALYRQALAGFDARDNVNDMDRLIHLHSFGRMLIEQDRLPEAERMLKEAVTRLRAKHTQDRVSLGAMLADYGRSLARLGKFEEAERILIESHQIRAGFPSDRWTHDSVATVGYLVDLYTAWGREVPHEYLLATGGE